MALPIFLRGARMKDLRGRMGPFQFLQLLFLLLGIGAVVMREFFPPIGNPISINSKIWSPALFLMLSVFCSLLWRRYELPQALEDYKLRLDGLRYRGLYPAEGQGSDDDVRRMMQSGQKRLALRLYAEIHQGFAHGSDDDVRFLKDLGAKRWAIQMYSQIHNATLREARAAVDAL